MPKKALGVWISSSVTAAAVIHLFDALNALFSKTSSVLLKFYSFLGPKLETVTPTTYFLTCAATAFTLWGLTCLIAFENPVETFLNKILSEAKKHSALEN